MVENGDPARADRVRRTAAVKDRRDELIVFLQDLGRVPSVTGAEGAVA